VKVPFVRLREDIIPLQLKQFDLLPFSCGETVITPLIKASLHGLGKVQNWLVSHFIRMSDNVSL